MHVFPRRVPNGKQGGGESWGTSVFGTSLSPPTTSGTSRRREELSAPLPAAGAVSPPRWLPGSGLREAGAAPGAYLPFRNIIPGKFGLREGEGAVGRGRKPGAQISTRILFAHPAPASGRAGRGMDRGMFSLSGGMHVERKWSSSQPNF